MSTESHITELERRHADLEQQINDAQSHPSFDSLQLSELKRQKLKLKDEISKLKNETNQTSTIH